jgi:hypothetical protein
MYNYMRQDTSVNVPIGEVIAEAEARGLSVQRLTGYGKVLDARLLAVEGMICQIVRTRQVPQIDYPVAAYAPLYLPRTTVADCLIYVAFPTTGSPRFYVVPRGVLTKDTGWSLNSLEQYRDAWQVFNEHIAPDQTERHFTTLNWQLQAVMDAAKDAALDVTLIGLKKRTTWPTFVQRRVLVNGRKCRVYACPRLSLNPEVQQYKNVFLRLSKDDWADFNLYALDGTPHKHTIFVIPSRALTGGLTTASLDNPDLQFYKENWSLLTPSQEAEDSIRPIKWRQPKIPRPAKKPSMALIALDLRAKQCGLPVEPAPAGAAGTRAACFYISQKPCQIVQASFMTLGKSSGRYVSLSVPKRDWAEFLIFFIPGETEGGAPTFYVVPRSRILKPTTLSPTSSWLKDYREAWHLLC